MSIQQSFNQGLMGTTFLLGQVPGFKQAQESASQESQFRNLAKSQEKTLNIVSKHYGGDNNIPEEALSKVERNVDATIEAATHSSNPRLAARAIIASTPSNRVVQAKQAEAKIKDRFEELEKNRKRALDSIQYLRSEISNKAAKSLINKTNRKVDREVEEERRKQNGANK